MSNYKIHQMRDEVLFDHNLTHFDARLLLVLLWHRNRQNYACFPSQKMLAKELDCSAEHVSKRLHACRDLGYVGWKKGNQGLDYWFPWLGDERPYQRNADSPTPIKIKKKPNSHMNSSSSSNLHKTSSAEPSGHEPQFNSHMNYNSSSDMNHSSSSNISPEITPEITLEKDAIFEQHSNDLEDYEQARPPRAVALGPLNKNAQLREAS